MQFISIYRGSRDKIYAIRMAIKTLAVDTVLHAHGRLFLRFATDLIELTSPGCWISYVSDSNARLNTWIYTIPTRHSDNNVTFRTEQCRFLLRIRFVSIRRVKAGFCPTDSEYLFVKSRGRISEVIRDRFYMVYIGIVTYTYNVRLFLYSYS